MENRQELPGLEEHDNPLYVELAEGAYTERWYVNLWDRAYETYVTLDAQQALILLEWLEQRRERLLKVTSQYSSEAEQAFRKR